MSDDEEKLVGFKVAIAMSGISRTEIHRRIKAGKFPVPIKDGPYPSSRSLFSLKALRKYVADKLR